MDTVKIEFTCRSFVIEEAMVVLYNFPVAGLFPSQMITGGIMEAAIDGPGEIRGMLTAAKIRRHDGRIFSAGMEFKHEITPAELRSGVAVIDINSYKELVIRVRDPAQRPLANSIISLIRWELEGSLDLYVNEDGEFTMLLPPERYGTRAPGGPPVQFEVTDQDPDQRRIELEAAFTR
jgi:hypothetical protein